MDIKEELINIKRDMMGADIHKVGTRLYSVIRAMNSKLRINHAGSLIIEASTLKHFHALCFECDILKKIYFWFLLRSKLFMIFSILSIVFMLKLNISARSRESGMC